MGAAPGCGPAAASCLCRAALHPQGTVPCQPTAPTLGTLLWCADHPQGKVPCQQVAFKTLLTPAHRYMAQPGCLYFVCIPDLPGSFAHGLASADMWLPGAAVMPEHCIAGMAPLSPRAQSLSIKSSPAGAALAPALSWQRTLASNPCRLTALTSISMSVILRHASLTFYPVALDRSGTRPAAQTMSEQPDRLDTWAG